MGNKFKYFEDKIIFTYSYETYDYERIISIIEEKGYFLYRNTFTLKKENILSHDDYEINFVVGTKYNDLFYLLDKEVFNIEHNFYFDKRIKKLKNKYFYSYYESIIKKISDILAEDFHLVINGIQTIKNNYITIDEYEQILKLFPTYRETNLYVRKRVTEVISNYFETSDSISKYNEFIKKNRKPIKKHSKFDNDYENRIVQYEGLLSILEELIKKEDTSEEECQNLIINILLVLFPKYLICLDKVYIVDNNNDKKILDYMLVDANGYVDIIEIKKPGAPGPLTAHNNYRKNYIPISELSGSITQVEKYLYCLVSNKEKNEAKINERLRKIDFNVDAKINNPQGYIIYGRNNKMNNEQINDFEIIKRNYKNVIDIFTYDDLIYRLKNSIDYFKSKINT